jgi:hypothetical protein
MLGTTRSAFAIRSRHVALSCSYWAMVRIVAIGFWDSTGEELAVATHAALQVHNVGGVAHGANALGALLTLPGEPLVLVARGCHVLRPLLHARCRLWRAARTALVRLVVRVVEGLGHPVERLFSLRQSLSGSPLFGGHGRRDGLAQVRLDMAEVW